ncbi:MAG: guanylate kinase [Acidobacteriota bacterium]
MPGPSGDVWVISAPSGAGKTTLLRKLFAERDDLRTSMAYSVSHTTRAPRAGEVDGEDYYFLDDGAFDHLIETGAFLEWAHVHGRRYGTSRREVERLLADGRDVILELDVQGAAQVREALPGVVTLFVLPPSFDALSSRLRRRGSETAEQRARRLENAIGEIRQVDAYDYVIVNDDLALACEALAAVFQARRCRHHRMRIPIQHILATLPAATPARDGDG